MTDRALVSVKVNGAERSAEVDVRVTLADFLRDHLDLTGTHLGCEHGVCGACTILLDGKTVRSCLMLAVQAEGATIETVESLASPNGDLHPIQEAFSKHHALQCGFCTPGFLMSVKEYLDDDPSGDETEIRQRLSGNLCRCTGYQNIVTAVQSLVDDSE
ncbi:MAG: 2Fe-2S iron-sulfur cluster binding domain-containing protein [Acidimicrobiia bacterium]|nr:2Fe-2S iron-sulfur cluster binding domain-containing protein [Acidimicrobiia bacterium]